MLTKIYIEYACDLNARIGRIYKGLIRTYHQRTYTCEDLPPAILNKPSSFKASSCSVHTQSSIGNAMVRPATRRCSSSGYPNTGFSELSSETGVYCKYFGICFRGVMFWLDLTTLSVGTNLLLVDK